MATIAACHPEPTKPPLGDMMSDEEIELADADRIDEELGRITDLEDQRDDLAQSIESLKGVGLSSPDTLKDMERELNILSAAIDQFKANSYKLKLTTAYHRKREKAS